MTKILGKRSVLAVAVLGLTVGLAAIPTWAQVNPELDPALKPYGANGDHVSGTLPVGTSETAKALVEQWGKQFQSHHSKVKVETTVIKYTETQKAIEKGVHPIPEGAKMVVLSHPLSTQEKARIKAASGVEPIEVPVALDGIVLVVNAKNPLKGLTMEQVAAMFSEPKDGKGMEHWSHVGVDGKFGEIFMNLYGRDDTSGTFAAFQEMALKGARQRKEIHTQPGSMSVIVEVGSDEAGIGYAATGFASKSKRVRAVPLAKKEGEPYILPTNETVVNGDYPLARYIYIYAIPNADGSLDPTIKHYISHVLSRDGQALVKEEGFFPLPNTVIEQALRKIAHGTSVRAASVTSSK